MGIESICQHFFSATIYQDLEEKAVLDLALINLFARGKEALLVQKSTRFIWPLLAGSDLEETSPYLLAKPGGQARVFCGSPDRWLKGISVPSVFLFLFLAAGP